MIFILIFNLVFNSFLLAQQINNIQITGNKKVSNDAIYDKLINKVGQELNNKVFRVEIQNIYDLGFFEEVAIYFNKSTNTLEYKLKEKPIVTSIIFKGNNEISNEDLEKELTFKPYTVLNIDEIRRSKQKLLKFYEQKGYYLASIREELNEIDTKDDIEAGDTSFELIFNISENSKITVQKITFIGNKNISDNEIKEILMIKEKTPFSWMSGSGSYIESAVDADKERLAYFYTTKGYPAVKVAGPITFVSPDKKFIYLSYNIEEGSKYLFGNIEVNADDYIFTKEELDEKIVLKPGEIYNSMEIRRQMIEFQNLYGDKGYAFTNVIPLMNYNETDKTVDLVFKIDKGNLAYFNEINIVGNNKTRDKVIRRELRVKEGELYNFSKLELSKTRIRSLGYFEDVVFHQYSVKDKDGNFREDSLNIEIRLKERESTGQFMISAGYSTYEGFLMMATIQEENFFGYGQRIMLSANISSLQNTFMISFFDPYIFDTDWSGGIDIYRTKRYVRGYNTTTFGFQTKVGYSIAVFTKAYITYKLEDRTTRWKDNLSKLFNEEVENGITSSTILSIVRDERDDRLIPSKGNYDKVSLELAGLGGDKNFYRLILDKRYYHPIIWDVVFRARLMYGFIKPYNNQALPISENFLMGGIDTLRGYDYLTIGPQENDNDGNPFVIGGTNQILFNTEIELPLIPEANIKAVLFFDAGSVFNSIDSEFTLSHPLRYDWGFGFRWRSPIGPLRFEWGFPIDRRQGESKTVFQFSIFPSF